MLAAAPISPGFELGGYRVESILGEGGMGVVYLARQLRLDRRVALKVLSTELARDEEFRQRFIRESNAAAALDDPNILPIHDAGEADGHLYIAMRHVDGADLGHVLEARRRLTPRHVLSLVEQIGGALDAAHEVGLVHRDVKPANILIDRNGVAYLTDFGLAKRGAADDLAGSSLFFGTVDYCAPEQIAGGETDGRTDLYALGAVVYHALTGEPPFPRPSELETAEAHLHDPITPASHRCRTLPRGLDRVLETALAKNPDARHQTAAAFAAALADALDEETDRADVPALDWTPSAVPQPPDEGGRLTTELLRARLERERPPLWGRSPRARFVTRVEQTLDPGQGGKLSHSVLRERVDDAPGPMSWRELRSATPPEPQRDAGGRLTDDVLRAKIEEEKLRRRR